MVLHAQRGGHTHGDRVLTGQLVPGVYIVHFSFSPSTFISLPTTHHHSIYIFLESDIDILFLHIIVFTSDLNFITGTSVSTLLNLLMGRISYLAWYTVSGRILNSVSVRSSRISDFQHPVYIRIFSLHPVSGQFDNLPIPMYMVYVQEVLVHCM